MLIKRGRLTESGVGLGGLDFIGDIQGFWKRAPFYLSQALHTYGGLPS